MKQLGSVILSTAVLPCTAAAVQNPLETRPNIIFIMSDDHAVHAMGAYGSRVNETPHIDRLAREGSTSDSCRTTSQPCSR